MKELQSKKHPDFPLQIVSDEEYVELVRSGLAKRFIARDVVPLKNIIKSPVVVEITKKARKNKQKDND